MDTAHGSDHDGGELDDLPLPVVQPLPLTQVHDVGVGGSGGAATGGGATGNANVIGADKFPGLDPNYQLFLRDGYAFPWPKSIYPPNSSQASSLGKLMPLLLQPMVTHTVGGPKESRVIFWEMDVGLGKTQVAISMMELLCRLCPGSSVELNSISLEHAIALCDKGLAMDNDVVQHMYTLGRQQTCLNEDVIQVS